MYRTIVAGAVVGAKITGVCRSLIDVRAVCVRFALEFEHKEAASSKEDDVGSSKLIRELIFEKRGVLTGGALRVEDFANFTLQRSD